MEGILYGIPMDVIRYLFKAPKRENLGQYVNALSSLLEHSRKDMYKETYFKLKELLQK